ncbi:hypothetical protein PybrP1_012280 [[Pythium] brassicae (nom. inval.)]|nr:hypothetical protein PybrP1_012280 [[Pythium] brassicae (nom. inval.)]
MRVDRALQREFNNYASGEEETKEKATGTAEEPVGINDSNSGAEISIITLRGASDDQPRTQQLEIEKDDVNALQLGDDIAADDSKHRDGGSVGELSEEGSSSGEDEPAERVDEDSYERITAAFVGALGGQLHVDEGTVDMNALWYMEWEPAVSFCEVETSEYQQLVHENGYPTAETRRASSSPLSLFFHFFPKPLWVEVCEDTNRYRLQTLDKRAKDLKAKQKKRKEADKTVNRIAMRRVPNTTYKKQGAQVMTSTRNGAQQSERAPASTQASRAPTTTRQARSSVRASGAAGSDTSERSPDMMAAKTHSPTTTTATGDGSAAGHGGTSKRLAAGGGRRDCGGLS